MYRGCVGALVGVTKRSGVLARLRRVLRPARQAAEVFGHYSKFCVRAVVRNGDDIAIAHSSPALWGSSFAAERKTRRDRLRDSDSEHDERYTHRLEAFSDVVIAFSLAQMSLNFGIPHRASDVYTHPVALTAFAVTFAVIVAFWWSHHRLFAEYFVPSPLNRFSQFRGPGVTGLVDLSVATFRPFRGVLPAPLLPL